MTTFTQALNQFGALNERSLASNQQMSLGTMDEMWDDFEEARFSYSWLGGRYPQANVSNFRLQ